LTRTYSKQQDVLIMSFGLQLDRMNLDQIRKYLMYCDAPKWLVDSMFQEEPKKIHVALSKWLISLYQYKLALEEIRDNHKPLKQIKK